MKNQLILLLITAIILTQTAFAMDLSKEAQATQTALNEANSYVIEMYKANFSINKVNDTYLLAKQDFDSKVILESKLADVDYSTILTKATEIKVSRDKAFSVNDELNALGMYLEPYRDKNLTETFALYNKAKDEFKDERYDESLQAINKCYDKISEEQSAQTTFRVFYDNTRKTIKNFLMDNWKYIVSGLFAAVIILIIGYKGGERYLIKRKIRHLELERNVLRSLIKDAQKEYFEKGAMAETDYHIKVKKFGELIRDIDRQIPLLYEQLAKVSKKDFMKEISGK